MCELQNKPEFCHGDKKQMLPGSCGSAVVNGLWVSHSDLCLPGLLGWSKKLGLVSSLSRSDIQTPIGGWDRAAGVIQLWQRF